MKSLITLLLVVVVVGSSAYGSEGLRTSKELLQSCESKSIREQLICYNFIVGVIETELMNENLCEDPSITYQRAIDDMIEQMHINPYLLKQSAVLTLIDELKSVYPCEHSEH